MSSPSKLHRAVIKQAIRDLRSSDVAVYLSAVTYIESAAFITDCATAGYPVELRDSLKEMMLISQTQRIFLSRKIIRLLDKRWGKKNPAEAGS